MGAVLAKFRKEKSSADLLEKLETEIRTIEKFSLTTQEKQKRLVGNFLVISIGLYAVGFLIFYFAFFPPTWMERITYSVPLLIFPLLIFLLRRLLAWYFQRKINKNSTKLTTLRAEKKVILEKVMEVETYNVASKLLSKYGNKSYAIKPLTAPTPQPENRIQNLNSSLINSGPSGPGTHNNHNQMPLLRLESSAYNNSQQTMLLTPRSSIHTDSASALRRRTVPSQYAVSPGLQQRRPYPIINQKTQGVLEKMVDYLIGDGPQNRYALICKECFAHNGMAREEEFEYATFRCAFCSALNPSRKSRPVAPKLPTTVISSPLNNRMTASGVDDSDSDDSSSDSSESLDAPQRNKHFAATEAKSEVPTAEDGIKDVNMNGDSFPSKEKEKPSETQAEDNIDELVKNENVEEQPITESETKS